MRVRIYHKRFVSSIAMLFLAASCSSDPKEPEEVVNTAEAADESVELDDLSSIEDVEDDAVDTVQEESGVELANEEIDESMLSTDDESSEPAIVTDEDTEQGMDNEMNSGEIAEEFAGDTEMASEDEETQAYESAQAETIEEPAADAVTPEEETASTAPMTETTMASNQRDGSVYIVRPGDSLAKISTIIYGSPSRWRDLAERNSIANPARIFPGDTISFSADTDSARNFANSGNSGERTVTVAAGDSLSKMAHRLFGNAGAWRYLWKMNENQIKNPNRIFVGQQLSFLNPVVTAELKMKKGVKVGQAD